VVQYENCVGGITMHHMKGWKILRKDTARRLRYQETQRLKQQAVKDFNKDPKVWGNYKPSDGPIKTFLARLVK